MRIKYGELFEKKRILYIDILRAAAIITIIWIIHMSDYSRIMNTPEKADFITIIALGIFVYISGFLLSKTSKDICFTKSIFTFYLKRFSRIYPLYILALLLFIPIYSLDLVNVISNVLLINTLNGQSTLTLWFISMICMFYLLFPWIVYKIELKKLIIKAIVVFVILNILAIFSYGSMENPYLKLDLRLIIYWPVFIVGIITGYSKKYLEMMGKWYVILLSFSISIVLTIIGFYDAIDLETGLGSINIGIHTYIRMSMAILYIPISIFIARMIQKIDFERSIRFISYLSFSMFLFHRIVFEILTRLYMPENEVVALTYLYILSIPAIIVVSYSFQKFYDIYIHSRFRKLQFDEKSFSRLGKPSD